MRLLAGFIGIDRHADPRVPDLSGARRDATALWALFGDSIEDCHPVLLADDAASLSAIRKLLDDTLGAAAENDVVILGFAGHGTPDHRLVAADTIFDDLPNTTLDMGELAERFRASKARAVICLLDCCFSGGASARVLQGAPAARDAFALASVAGKGRILMAASALDEEALEDPVSRHGYFTQAVLDTLLGAQRTLGVLELAEAVTGAVRAAAARTGHVQTPAVFGHVEGGLTLPRGRRGARFKKAFPELSGATVGADLADLVPYGLPEGAVEAWKARFPGLNALQQAAVNEHGVLRGASLLTIAPTSAGKTFVGELAAIQAIAQGRKAVFLLPFKALVNEKHGEFAELYGKRLGLRVARCSGDWQDQVGDVLRGKYDIAFFTYEKFLGISVSAPHLLRQVGLVVLDEAQFITEPGRGMAVELLLTQLVSARAKGVAPQLIALSAVIGATNGLEQWLGCGLLLATERPVPLREGVLDRSGSWRFRNADGSVLSEALLEHWDVRQRREKTSSQDVIVPLVRKLVDQGERVIVFRNRRGPTAGCAEYLCAELGLPPARSLIEALPTGDRSSTSDRLRNSLQGGVAFHSGDLSREERLLVEDAFRRPDGEVRVLVATSTVAAGVNTPASTVVIVETGFAGGGEPQPYTVAQYKNMAGRAGRLGYETEGKAIILADTPFERERYFRTYVEGQPEPIVSSFDPRSPGTWVLRLLAQVSDVSRSQVTDLVANTFGGYLAALRDPSWRLTISARIEQMVDRMIGRGLIEAEADSVRLTLLGRACGESPLSLESSLRLIELLQRAGPAALTPERLMVLVQALPEQDADYTPQGGGRKGEPNRPSELMSRYGREVVSALRLGAESDKTYYARCKRGLVLADWIDGVPVQQIESRYSPNAFAPMALGDIRGFADGTRYLLESAFRIAALVHEGAAPSEAAVAELLKRLDLGLPAEALALADLPSALTRGEYLALFARGLRTEADIRAVEFELLRGLIGAQARALRERLAPATLAAE